MSEFEVDIIYSDDPSHPHIAEMRELAASVFGYRDPDPYFMPGGAYFAGIYRHHDGQAPVCVSMGSMMKYGEGMLVTTMATHADYQRQGLGSRVLRALEGEAGNKVVTLEAWPEAVAFYEANGYSAELVDPDDEVVYMEKRLQP